MRVEVGRDQLNALHQPGPLRRDRFEGPQNVVREPAGRGEDADAVLAVCGEVLGDIRPAATILVVAGLYKPEMKVEIEVTAKRRSA